MDDLNLQLLDCVQTVEERVTERTRVEAMNARLETFFAYQVIMNEQLAHNRQVKESLPTFPSPPPPSYGKD